MRRDESVRTYGARAGRDRGSCRTSTGRAITCCTCRRRGRLSAGSRRRASDRREDIAHHLQVVSLSRRGRPLLPRARPSPPRDRG
jgi:hypothetical protein